MAAEGPVLDTSCARLAAAGPGRPRAGLQGRPDRRRGRRGAGRLRLVQDAEDPRRRLPDRGPRPCPALLAQPRRSARSAGRRTVIPPEQAIGGVRPAQQDLYELISQSKPILYSEAMWDRLGDHNPYSDLDITNDRMQRWHPLNQSLYVGYKVMLAGLLMISKGDRIAMNSSVETRYPFLDDDVIAFCAGIAPEYKLRGHDREVDPPPGRRPDPAPADRQPAQDDVPRQPVADLPRPPPARLGRPAPEPRVAPRDRLLRSWSRCSSSGRSRRVLPRLTPARFVFDVALTCVVSTQLWHHIYCGGGLCDLPTWEPPARGGRHGPCRPVANTDG